MPDQLRAGIDATHPTTCHGQRHHADVGRLRGHQHARLAALLARARELGIDLLISVGGDGSQAIALRLHELGLPVIGVPKTIDNDLEATVETFGFGTAVQVASDALDRLRTTA